MSDKSPITNTPVTRSIIALLTVQLIFMSANLCLGQCNHTPIHSYFPTSHEWEKVELERSKKINKRKLNQALKYAKEQKSSSILILYNGKIMTEKYWNIKRPSSRYLNYLQTSANSPLLEDVASIQKSVVSLLCGIAIGKNLLDLSKPVSHYLGDSWSQSERESQITIEHLLTMSSGLDSKLHFKHPPGENWNYNTMAYKNLIKVLESVTQKGINSLSQKWIFEKLGMQFSEWKILSGKNNPYRFVTTPRDLARLGLLVMNNGCWRNDRIIDSEQYIAKAFSPKGKWKPDYGYLFWLNAGRSFIKTAPSDMITMFGALNRYVYVLPKLSMVVVRLGDKPEEGFNEKFWSLLMKATT